HTRVVDRDRAVVLAGRRAPIELVTGEVRQRGAVLVLGRREPAQDGRAAAYRGDGDVERVERALRLTVADGDHDAGIHADVGGGRRALQPTVLVAEGSPGRKIDDLEGERVAVGIGCDRLEGVGRLLDDLHEGFAAD